jgi:parallel beta-helix repeat protein
MRRRGQTAIEYLLLLGGITFFIIIILAIGGNFLGTRSNQLNQEAGSFFGVLQNVSVVYGAECSLSPSPASGSPTWQSNITVRYRGLSPAGNQVNINCGTATVVTAQNCTSVSNTSYATCSANCTYTGTGTYGITATITNVACASTQVTSSGPVPDTTPPVNGSITKSPGPTYCTLSFDATEDSNLSVSYSPANGSGATTLTHDSFMTIHPADSTHNITGLSPGTTYTFTLTLCDASSNCATYGPDTCTTTTPTYPISACGSSYDSIGTYTLTGNVTGAGFCANFTGGSNGSTLNCMGNTFIGTGNYQGTGIFLNSVSDFLVYNCSATRWQRGLHASASDNVTIIYGNYYNNSIGIYFNPTNYSNVSDVRLTHNTQNGLFFNRSSHNTVRGVHVMNNSQYGAYLVNSTNNTFYNDTLSNNTWDGLRLLSSNLTNVTNNALEHNRIYGLFADGSYNGTYAFNRAVWNYANGIHIQVGNRSTIVFNNASNNSATGIFITQVHNTWVYGNNASNNNKGLWLSTGSTNNSVVSNYLTNNRQPAAGTAVGMHFDVVRNNLAQGNTITGNGYDGVRFNDGTGNRLISNTVSSNQVSGLGNPGILLTSEQNATVEGNTACCQPVNLWVFVGGNHTIRSNTLTSATGSGHGILFGGSGWNNVTGNTAAGNPYWGIAFTSAGATNNTVTSNTMCPSGGIVRDLYTEYAQNSASALNRCQVGDCEHASPSGSGLCTSPGITVSSCPLSCTATVSLSSPASGSTIPSGTAFTYLPAHDLDFTNATLWGNFTGTFLLNASNATPVVPSVLNTITTSVYPGYYAWNVRVCGTYGCSWASANYTVNVSTPTAFTGTNVANYTDNPTSSNDVVRACTAPSNADYVYVAGDVGLSDNWTVQKLFAGNLTNALNYTSDPAGASELWDVLYDGTYLYLAGFYTPGTTTWRIEKLFASNFTNVQNYTGTAPAKANALTYDGTYLYAAGWDQVGLSAYQWRVEKYFLSNLTNVANYTSNPSVYQDEANDITYGGDGYVYAVGYDETPFTSSAWRIEKLFTGNLSSAVNYSADIAATADLAFTVTHDGTYLYVGGSRSASTFLRVQKNFMANLTLDSVTEIPSMNGAVGSGYDGGGVNGRIYEAATSPSGGAWRMFRFFTGNFTNDLNYTNDPSANSDFVADLVFDGALPYTVYLCGNDATNGASDLQWRVEKIR